MNLQERDFFDETPRPKPAQLVCPHCRQPNQYALMWIERRKKTALPARADAEDRVRFAKAQSYLVRRDDKVSCLNPRCRKTFEISGLQTVVFL